MPAAVLRVRDTYDSTKESVRDTYNSTKANMRNTYDNTTAKLREAAESVEPHNNFEAIKASGGIPSNTADLVSTGAQGWRSDKPRFSSIVAVCFP